MKRIYYVHIIIIIALISMQCRKELSGENAFPGQGNNQSSPISATLQGNIVDENDQPAEGVVVTVGAKTVTTNSHGYFRIVDAPLDKNASVVTAQQPGYFTAYRTFRATSGVNQVVIKLIKKVLAGTIDASTGGNVTLINGSKVSLAANGVVDANGIAYPGIVYVFASYIDPALNDIGQIIPGSFMADDKNNKRVVLSSFGMLAVDLESPAAEKLQVAANSTAALTVPIPTSISSSAPASISLWYLDEQTGIWKEQGTAQKNGSNYVGTVKHFCYWNCDYPLPAISFSATFKTSDGLPLTNTYIIIKPAGSDSAVGYAHGFTDTLGQVSGLIPANINLVLDVYEYGQCDNVVYSKNIGPFAANTDLGTIVIPNSVTSLITIKGKLLSCSNTAVNSGYATIYFNNFVYNTSVNTTGDFSISIINCSGISTTCEIMGVDENAQEQGQPVTVPITGQVTDAGNIIACGTSTAMFVNYKLDGVNYSIATPPDSAFIAHSSVDSISSLTNTFLYGEHSADVIINFNFSGNPVPGIYPISSLSVNKYRNVSLVSPFNTTVTSFPQFVGEFYEGSFSGSFKDSLAVLHTIDCSFRIQ